MKKLKVNTGRKYEIIIDRGIINHCGEYIKKVSSPTRIAVVTDSNVHALYSQSVITSLKNLLILTAFLSRRVSQTIHGIHVIVIMTPMV